MNISKSRKFYTKTNKQLRRARNLYSYLILDSCINDVSMLVKCAKKCQKRGLYSMKTGLFDICVSLIDRICRLDIQSNPGFYKIRCSLYKPGVNSTNWVEYNYDGDRGYDFIREAVKLR